MSRFNPLSSALGDTSSSHLLPMLAAFDWRWLSIFVACIFIAGATTAIILFVVWITGGLSGRK